MIQILNDIFKDIPSEENTQKKQKIKGLEDLKPYVKEMKKALIMSNNSTSRK